MHNHQQITLIEIVHSLWQKLVQEVSQIMKKTNRWMDKKSKLNLMVGKGKISETTSEKEIYLSLERNTLQPKLD